MKFHPLLLCSLLYSSVSLHSDSWKIFLYMEVSDGLSDTAFKNITDIIRAKPHDTLEFLIQLHAYEDVAVRYQVTDKGLTFLEETTLTNDCKKNFIDAVGWAFANNTADHTMLILSNHGWGILDPVWNEETQKWEADNDGLSNQCVIKRSGNNVDLAHVHSKHHKGFMFMVNPRVYLTNQEMVDGFAAIHQDILHGKKIDIVAFDTCMGATLEVAYELAPFAHYLLGVQSCALRDGFDYHNIVQTLNQVGNDSLRVARGVVAGFDAYYGRHDHLGIYTFSAIDLEKIPAVAIALDTVAQEITVLSHVLLANARSLTHRFCMWPMYADPVGFLKIVEQLAQEENLMTLSLHNALHAFYQAVAHSIVARCGGDTTQDKAYGYACYLPSGNSIYQSYPSTLFAQQTQWVSLLQKVCDGYASLPF